MLISVLKSKKDWQMFLATFLIVAFIISGYAWIKQGGRGSLYSTFGNSSYLAGFLIFAIGFAAVLLQEQISFGKKHFPYLNFLFIPLILFFTLTLIFTKTRGAYAGLAGGFGLLTLLTLLFLRKEKKKLTICLSAISITGLIFIGLIFTYRESNFVQSRPILKRTTDIVNIWQTASVKERLLTWQIAIKAFKDKPIFGWGPENFDAAFNKHYDYRVGLEEPWFDRVHNQSLQYLADGGLFLFSFYLFWLFSVFYLIFKIFKKKKLLATILASTCLAYLIQGLFLFDVFPVYLGLFVFLGFVCFNYRSIYHPEELSFSKDENERKNRSAKFSIKTKLILFIAFCLVLFLISTTVWLPYRANSFA
ncbi:O-antigen ligase family protein, partial [Patescibacteria group bacterium]|nr:O-antigen ligase family protein [Patescibacteria group bacterium]